MKFSTDKWRQSGNAYGTCAENPCFTDTEALILESLESVLQNGRSSDLFLCPPGLPIASATVAFGLPSPDSADKLAEITAAGLFGIFTRFPFNPLPYNPLYDFSGYGTNFHKTKL